MTNKAPARDAIIKAIGAPANYAQTHTDAIRSAFSNSWNNERAISAIFLKVLSANRTKLGTSHWSLDDVYTNLIMPFCKSNNIPYPEPGNFVRGLNNLCTTKGFKGGLIVPTDATGQPTTNIKSRYWKIPQVVYNDTTAWSAVDYLWDARYKGTFTNKAYDFEQKTKVKTGQLSNRTNDGGNDGVFHLTPYFTGSKVSQECVQQAKGFVVDQNIVDQYFDQFPDKYSIAAVGFKFDVAAWISKHTGHIIRYTQHSHNDIDKITGQPIPDGSGSYERITWCKSS